MNYNDMLKASAIAGGTLGAVGGFMKRGQQLEERGTTPLQQVTGGLTHGVITGAIGVGVGVGVSSTAAALKGILKR